MRPRALLSLALIALLALPGEATWSIVVVDRRTGEVAIAGATCIARINLADRLPAIVVGQGGGVVQSAGQPADLVPMAAGLREGLDPAEILAMVQAFEPDPDRLQTGIVSLYPGAPVTFSGPSVGAARKGVVGEVGDLAYAIQGNVITGGAVVDAAEQALLQTPGDLGQKLLAAMQAARDFGGDGRCSCNENHPTNCGSPPASFEKTAHVGFMLMARIGDPDAPCVLGTDCADGAYYLRLNVRGPDAQVQDPDPVDQLEQRYAVWRAARAGRPDGILSSVRAVDSLPADGTTKRLVMVRLVDVDGVPLDHGGADVQVRTVDGSRSFTSASPVVDHGDGTYSFSLTAGTRTGTDRFVITAADGFLKATLYPYLVVRSDPPAALHAGHDAVSASRGAVVPFVLARSGSAHARYLVLASASGNAPGIALRGGAILPLVPDPLFFLSLERAGNPAFLPDTIGALDELGRAEPAFVAPPGALLPLVGRRLDWAGLVLEGGRLETTNPVSFEIEH